MLYLTRRHLVAGGAGLVAANTLFRATPAQAGQFDGAVSAGLAYFQEQAAVQKRLCADLTAAIAGGDQELAEYAYEMSRAPYEQIEVHAGAFPDIDFAIDARPYAVEGGETNADFRGFHRIEALIYRDHDLAAALPYAEALERAVEDLSRALSEPGRFSASLFFDGMLALSEEVASKKISSEEETWSDLSLIIFRHNFLGIQSQLAGFRPEIAKVSDRLVENVDLVFAQAQATLEPFFEGPRVTRYSDVRAGERAAIARSAYAIRDAMQTVREVLQIA